jgi:hypothetical protein
VLHMSYLTHSRFGGFLLHRGWFRLTLTRKARAVLCTGCNAVSPRQYIHRADDIGVVGVSTLHTLKLGLCLPALSCQMPTSGTRLARVVRRHWNQYPAIPVEFVFQLAAKLEADAALGDSCAVRALDPRPKGRGFPRKMDEISNSFAKKSL